VSDIFAHPSFDNHEQVVFATDKASGLTAIIAIHNSALGPAAGGCRMYPYASTDEALTDVLRLSRGMTMKNAAAGLPLGGGKCVIIGDASSGNKDDLLRALARHVQRLGGTFWTAIDVGVSAEDADTMAEASDYIFARASEFAQDDPPSHYTSLGGFHAVCAVAHHIRDIGDLTGLKVAVQGVGQTGADLISQLVEKGVQVIAADVNTAALSKVAAQHGIRTCAPEDIHRQDVDIFAPCALGGILNDRSIPELRCKGIAGLANNQLERPEHGQQLLDRGIAYAPDFVANAGGVMRATLPIFTDVNRERALENISGLYSTIRNILDRSVRENIPTEVIAEQIAYERINAA